MELIHMILNLVVIPSSIGFLFVLVPVLLAYRTFFWVLGFLFPENVKSKVVVITGASSGIGEHIAYEYAKRGARLTLAARREEKLRTTAKEAKRLGAEDVLIVVADVQKEEDCKKIIDQTIERWHRLDHLVNNAGVAMSFLMEETKSPEIKTVMDTTFWGNVYPTYYALPYLKKSRGHITAIASIAAYVPYPRMAVYNAAKAGIFNFYDTLRVEIGTKVSITIVAPGWVESEMTAGKFVQQDGKLGRDTETRDMHVGPFPVEPVWSAASAAVNGALRRQRYVFVPFWYTTFLFLRVFAPDLMDIMMQLTFVAPPGQPPLSKYIMEKAQPQKFLYPEGIKSQ